MARDDDPWKRLRDREDEEEEEPLSLAARRGVPQKTSQSKEVSANYQLLQLLQSVEPLIEQVNSLYNQFLSGIQTLPPTEKRKSLDQMIQNILAAHKPTSAVQFRCTSIHSNYLVHREKWDRMMRDLETGKIKRRKAP